MTGHANLAGGYHDELAARKLLSVFIQYPIEVVDLGLKVCSWEAKEDDAGMGELLVEDELAEIAVGDHQNPALCLGDSQDVLIGKTMRIVARDDVNVMAKLAKIGYQPEVGTLVEEELHRMASERAPFGGCGETSSPVTRARA